MPKKLTVADELRLAIETRAMLDNKIKELQDQAWKMKRPPVPPTVAGDRFSIEVRFPGNPKYYEFLLMRVGDNWYTTGVKREHAFFPNWEALLDWLRGPDVEWHGGLRVLRLAATSYVMPPSDPNG